VIASYQSSILSSQVVNTEDLETNEINVSMDHHNRSVCEKPFVKGGEGIVDY
jgi:hypothetical protein